MLLTFTVLVYLDSGWLMRKTYKHVKGLLLQRSLWSFEGFGYFDKLQMKLSDSVTSLKFPVA